MDNAAIDDLYTGGIARAREATKLRQIGSFAYFPGTGPEGETCAGCIFFGKRPRSDGSVYTGKCGMYAAVRRIKVEWVNYIPANTAACKHFDQVGELDNGTAK